ncbi:alkaline phosphatase PhoX [Baekduia soli]|uniref:alkaline phosphatase PhoX n=1 Tax=Baekduia soli TaxID=496014 RepID=UPI001E50A6F4|nr:alkaline phosphatase PhoX [Baekduia soli]
MDRRRKMVSLVAGSALAAGAAFAATGAADSPFGSGPELTGVPTANTRSDGYAPASRLSPQLTQVVVAQGSTKLENPSALTSYYGYDNDVLNAAGEPQMVPTPTNTGEAHKTEPDKNTYLVLKGQHGADPAYDYGRHFLFQGHEGGAGGASSLTRINLDADATHRVTLLATQDSAGNPLSPIDGSTWDPFAQRLLLTTENPAAPTYAATADFPSKVDDVSGALGRGGYEGIQDDSAGNIWIVEDIGGSKKVGTTAKVPNSFVYRYVPAKPGDLAHGRLQALQVTGAGGQPITQATQTALNSPDQVALHTYGTSFKTTWVTVHDTAVDGTAPFNANTLAKTAGATPFKRPENGQFRPGSDFKDFFFDETGDTDATSPENDTAGGWGSVLKLTQKNPSATTGTLTLFYKGDQAHTGLDNVAFLSKNVISFVEDAGDTLHGQRNALDSAFAFDVNTDYGNAANQPVRWLAEGRDASATIDAANAGFGKNDGDNEITGLHVSDGNPTVGGILGAQNPRLGNGRWRWFYTQQHGDNTTYEVLAAPRHDD